MIVGGVAFASLKNVGGSYVLKFDTTALYFGMLANAFAASDRVPHDPSF